jgi:uncharacterized Zn-binding protein involved in type VI secretion
MPKVIRVGLDFSQGHCFPPLPATMGSPDLFIGGIPVVRETDLYGLSHNCGQSNHNMGTAIEGSQTVFNHGLGLHGDSHKISCGDVADNGSTTVFIDEGGNSSAPGITETIGYTVGLPVVEYPFTQIEIYRYRVGIIFPTYVVCNKFYQFGELINGIPSIFPGDLYSPLTEENSGVVFKDKSIPIQAEIRPALPPFLNFDPSTASLFFGGNFNVFPDGIYNYEVKLTNYVGEARIPLRIKLTTLNYNFGCG